MTIHGDNPRGILAASCCARTLSQEGARDTSPWEYTLWAGLAVVISGAWLHAASRHTSVCDSCAVCVCESGPEGPESKNRTWGSRRACYMTFRVDYFRISIFVRVRPITV